MDPLAAILTPQGTPRHLAPLRTDVDGLSVFVWAAADPPPEAPAVVLVHGLGLSSTYLLPTAVRLAPDYRVFVPDLPGFGRSDKPQRALDVAGLADALADWMAAAGLPRAAMLGNSFGCQIIVECAARHPERVERAILQGPTTPREERNLLWQFIRWRQNPNPYMAPIAKHDYRAAGYDRVARTFFYSLEHRLEERFAEIQAPMLVVRGGRDPICRHGWAEEVAHRLPRGRLVVIPGLYHTLVFTNALELVRVSRPFLDDRGPPLAVARAVRPPQAAMASPSKQPVARFDSASAMLRAIGLHLQRRDFRKTGWTGPAKPAARWVRAAVNALPGPAKRQLAIWSEGIAEHETGGVRAERIARFAVAHYPRRPYPAAMIGASNGALAHLCAALGIPWLPQTMLIPVRHRGLESGNPDQEREWGRGPGARLLGANPDLVLHQMVPNADGFTIGRLSRFYVKHRNLPQAYRRFLTETLEPGGTLFIAECNLRRPSAQVQERHLFQQGALSDAGPAAYAPERPGFLAQQGAQRRSRAELPGDGETPEAEWGFEPGLRPELEQFAREHGYRVRRIVFDHPEDPSPFVADLYRDWYRRRRLVSNRLLVSSFIVQPHWTLRTGSVPFWMAFNVAPSAEALERYLDASETYDDIYLMLFSHGIRSVGVTPIPRWKSILRKARRQGRLVGAGAAEFPDDFAAFADVELQRAIRARYPIPRPLMLDELDTFLDRAGGRYRVRWPG